MSCQFQNVHLISFIGFLLDQDKQNKMLVKIMSSSKSLQWNQEHMKLLQALMK